MSRPKIAGLLAVGLVAAGLLSMVVYTAVSPDGQWFQLDYDDRAQLVADWCENVGSALDGQNGGPLSFAEVATLARSGALKEPERPPSADPAALDRWQAEHVDYTTSTYLENLEGYPREIGLQHVAFTLGMEDAHAGRRLQDPAHLLAVASDMDEYRAERCGTGST
ncbi:MAG: hypothetical protein JWM47_1669 [Acidimicrobiales bacterium]|nr:hypothetical protein [Acidimicrobiales bacterium]